MNLNLIINRNLKTAGQGYRQKTTPKNLKTIVAHPFNIKKSYTNLMHKYLDHLLNY